MGAPKEGSGSAGSGGGDTRIFRFGSFELDASSLELHRERVPVNLGRKAAELLLYLVQNQGRIVPKREIYDRVWPDVVISDSTLATNISEIRHALGDDGGTQRMLETRRRRGYQFVLEVEERQGPGASQDSSSRVSVTDLAPQSEGRNHVRLRRAAIVATALILSLAAMSWWSGNEGRQVARALAFEERDWVLISDFENRTGEELFDGTLEHALGRTLSNSRFVNVVPRERIRDALGLMRKPMDSRVDAALGREICLRDGGIRALLAGRVEKLGSAYVLSVDLLDPARGVSVVALREEASGEDEIWPAVRHLASRVRESLGEELALIRSNEATLARVTTPSLRALRLYSEAVAAITEQRVAEELLRQAIRQDPEFASAYTHLAFSLSNQGRPQSEILPYAEKALDLSQGLPDRERYFIQGAYFRFTDQPDEAIASYKALLRLHPDHVGAINSLPFVLRRAGRGADEAIPYLRRSAELRPYSYRQHSLAYLALEQANRWSESLIYLRRAAELATSDDEQTWPEFLAAMRVLAGQDYWLAGDLDGLQRDLDRWEETLDSPSDAYRAALATWLRLAYVSLGQVERARELARVVGGGNYADNLVWDAANRGNLAPARELFHSNPGEMTWAELAHQVHHVSLDLAVDIVETRESLAELEAEARSDDIVDPLDIGNRIVDLSLAQGALALAEGRSADAVPLLEDVVQRELDSPTQPAYRYFAAAEYLALAWQGVGRLEHAVQVLEEASRERRRTSISGRLRWMSIRLRLAELYRSLDRDAEAVKIENEIRGLMAYADSDFWLVRRLDGIPGPLNPTPGPVAVVDVLG